jgi:2-haloacid dehalogenase
MGASAKAGAFVMSEADESPVRAVVWDVGRVLYHWELRHLFRKLIADERELDWFLAHVVTEEWHFEHDAGRELADMVAERSAIYPDHAHLIAAYATRFNETIPGPVEGTHEIAALLAERGVPQFAITNFGSEFWAQFRPTAPVFDLFADIVVSGVEKLAKPDPRIFDLAASRFGHDPREMLFIDDNRANIEAAAALGWQVHHFHDADTLAQDTMMAALLAG